MISVDPVILSETLLSSIGFHLRRSLRHLRIQNGERTPSQRLHGCFRASRRPRCAPVRLDRARQTLYRPAPFDRVVPSGDLVAAHIGGALCCFARRQAKTLRSFQEHDMNQWKWISVFIAIAAAASQGCSCPCGWGSGGSYAGPPAGYPAPASYAGPATYSAPGAYPAAGIPDAA